MSQEDGYIRLEHMIKYLLTHGLGVVLATGHWWPVVTDRSGMLACHVYDRNTAYGLQKQSCDNHIQTQQVVGGQWEKSNGGTTDQFAGGLTVVETRWEYEEQRVVSLATSPTELPRASCSKHTQHHYSSHQARVVKIVRINSCSSIP